MNKMLILDRIKAHYDAGGNIIQHLRALDNKSADDPNSKYDVLISYDFQAGTYSRGYNHEHKLKYTHRLAEIINGLRCKKDSLLEAGVGEATTLVGLLNHEGMSFKNIYGNDISWSRIKFAQKFFRSKMSALPLVENNSQREGGGVESQLFVGDLFSLPLLDNSIDVVFTSHSLEPNGGHERELLEELYRVTNNYLILLEPGYEFASEEARARMKKHGYVTNLYDTARQLGYKILMHELYMVNNPLNPTGLIVIEKNADNSVEQPFCDPLTHTPMTIKGNVYFSQESLISYPIVNDVPCLMKEYAIVTTKMNEFY